MNTGSDLGNVASIEMFLQYSSLENPMDRGVWWATVHGVAKSDTTEDTDIVESNIKLVVVWFVHISE